MTQSPEVTTDPESGGVLEKVLVELPPDHWSGHGGERVWAKPVGKGVFEIRNTPWHASNVNWGDTVRCRGVSEAGLPIVRDVVSSSGHRTMRIFFAEAVDASHRDNVLRRLHDLGATHESLDGRFYSLHVEPEVNLGSVVEFVVGQEQDGTLGWESTW